MLRASEALVGRVEEHSKPGNCATPAQVTSWMRMTLAAALTVLLHNWVRLHLLGSVPEPTTLSFEPELQTQHPQTWMSNRQAPATKHLCGLMTAYPPLYIYNTRIIQLNIRVLFCRLHLRPTVQRQLLPRAQAHPRSSAGISTALRFLLEWSGLWSTGQGLSGSGS